MTNKFKIGDNVKIVNVEGTTLYKEFINKIGTIIENDGGNYLSYFVKLDDFRLFLNENNLEFSNPIQNFTTKELKNELSARGFCVDVLWSTDDVKADISDDKKMDILKKVFNNEYIVGEINEGIRYHINKITNEIHGV